MTGFVCVLCTLPMTIWLRRIKLEQMLGQRASQNQLAVIFFFFKQLFLILYIHGVGLCFLCERGKDEAPTLGSSVLSTLHIFLGLTWAAGLWFLPWWCPIECVTELKGVKI